jgi:hypothetical protein
MDKKDIYEHLAKIYLDASLKRKRKKKESRLFKNLFIASIVIIFLLGSYSIFNILHKGKGLNYQIALVLVPDVVKINFNFNPAKKEIYSLNLNNLDLNKFKTLAFAVKNKNCNDYICLRVEITNKFQEKSEIYIKNISHHWQDYKLLLDDFKRISDWSEIPNISFIVEEWNTKKTDGVVYIDNVRLIR